MILFTQVMVKDMEKKILDIQCSETSLEHTN